MNKKLQAISEEMRRFTHEELVEQLVTAVHKRAYHAYLNEPDIRDFWQRVSQLYKTEILRRLIVS